MIRRALVDEWPALSHLYGIHPWDMDRLTLAELEAYVTQMRANG